MNNNKITVKCSQAKTNNKHNEKFKKQPRFVKFHGLECSPCVTTNSAPQLQNVEEITYEYVVSY